MIPYEELVIALQTWRAKQGLPVGQLSGALTPPPVQAAPPMRAGPPMAPPSKGNTGPQQAFLGNVATPPPLANPEDSLDVDDAALIDEAAYENEGDDFAMGFSAAGAPPPDENESTAVGNIPDDRPTQTTLDDGAPPSSNRNDDW